MNKSAIQLRLRRNGIGPAALITFLALTLGETCTYAQQPLNRDSAALIPDSGSLLLKVDSARPVARAVLNLQARYGYVITYEDPQYLNDDDLIDAAPTVRKNYSTSRPASQQKLLVPKASQLTIHLPAAASINSQDLAQILQELIGLQGTTTYGGHFRVEQSGNVFHIIPTEARDHDGNWKSQAALLDTRISIPVQDRSEKELYRTIAAAVSSAAHVSMSVVLNGGIVIGPANASPKRTDMGATDEPARSVLMRALALSTVKRTWVLMHTTEDGSNAFSLNILDLPAPTPPDAGPAGTSISPGRRISAHD